MDASRAYYVIVIIIDVYLLSHWVSREVPWTPTVTQNQLLPVHQVLAILLDSVWCTYVSYMRYLLGLGMSFCQTFLWTSPPASGVHLHLLVLICRWPLLRAKRMYVGAPCMVHGTSPAVSNSNGTGRGVLWSPSITFHTSSKRHQSDFGPFGSWKS